MGADIAPSRHPRGKRAEYLPKGFVSSRRTERSTRVPVPPVPPAFGKVPPPPDGKRDVRFHYSSVRQKGDSEGTYANLVIAGPDKEDPNNKVKLGLGDYHTLTEISVQSADGKQAVEVGWTIDRLLNGNDQPHLFVYHWVDGKRTCYNTCDFSAPDPKTVGTPSVGPGGALPAGTVRNFGIQFSGNAWWIAYGTEWIGYYPATNWQDPVTKEYKFTRATQHQWFGEVASSSLDPCTSMGTGETSGLVAKSARIGGIYLVNPKSAEPIEMVVTSDYIDKKTGKLVEVPARYTGERPSNGTLRFGGPATLEIDKKTNPACLPPPDSDS
jgi:hypothetical protein